ncbi:hypothetical protein BaRGS_00029973 [Batillaria attramentaria]|uniref:Palmitoyltransferase n=1 Tax=Batillaria attramentaria TaxID=370345 RepID=A0ABD0JUM6_9CAEN
MATVMEAVRKRLPKTPTDWFSFCFLLSGMHGVFVFEVFVVLPFLYKDVTEFSLMYYIHILAALFIYVNTLGNVIMVMITEAGTRGLVLPVILKPGWRFCSVCECNAPPRSYHCNTCRTCVLRRDHHCVFTGCCIGHKNQRYFVVMVLYFWIAALYATIMNVDLVYHLFGEFSLKTLFVLFLPLLAWMFRVIETVTMTMAFMISLCLIVCLLTLALLGYHLLNVINGQTVFEKTHRIRDYDLGPVNNLKVVFGKNWAICWLFPLIPSPLLGNGLEFPKKNEIESEKDM